jgi:Ca2+-binding RTX toxin-like protein
MSPRVTRRIIRFALPGMAAAVFLLGPTVAQAKVRTTVRGTLLTVHGGKKNDRAAVACSGGLVKVNGKDPRGGAVSCSLISEVDAIMGAGNDRVNLSGVGTATGFGQRDLEGFGTGTGAAAELGRGNDRYVGGASAFNLALGGAGSDRLIGGTLRDHLEGGAHRDKINGRGGRDVLLGNADADTIGGGAGDDLLSGNAGDDLLNGGDGDDLIGGGLGMDTLLGGAGNDRLIGGPGKDRLRGGPGSNELIQNSPTGK